MMSGPLKPIPGFSGYFAGRDGSLWTSLIPGPSGLRFRESPRRLIGFPRKEDGRLRYTLRRDDGKYVRRYGSHFVLMAFVGPRPDGLEACHDDGNCLDDSVSNLRWDTHTSNIRDRIRHGIMDSGESHWKCKILDSDIPRIIAMRAFGMRFKTIGEAFDVTEQRVFQICKKGAR